MTRQWGRLEALASGRLKSLELSIDEIDFELPPNASIDYAAVETLARIVSESGIRTPIEIYFKIGDPIPYACNGFELRTAVDFARAKQWVSDSRPMMVTVTLENSRYEATDRLFARLLESGGKSLSVLERADCIRELVALNHPIKGIAQQLQTKKQYITRLLQLSQATPATRQMIDERQVTATTVMNAIARHGASTSEQLLIAAVREAEKEGKKATGKFVSSFLDQQKPFKEVEHLATPSTTAAAGEQFPTSNKPNSSSTAEVGNSNTDRDRTELIERLQEAHYSKLTTEELSELVEKLHRLNA